MRLSKVKLSGFKSFVDPTTFELSGRLNGVVGPNGCGKSNIIDAVRWVMGESSAKQLRGESMNDVIFNGATSRKASGFASIELVFDNREGKLGGQWASFSELSIKRVLERSGQSSYFLNGARCRRRDITDIFLGTGLGPRSYAIIEQGMISRIVESKPEELRVFFEEAAGISKYKEQKRETETRIEHTRSNLLRLLDVREELQKQLAHLEKQAKKAEYYQKLKNEERTLSYASLKQKRTQLSVDQTVLQQEIGTLEAAVRVDAQHYNQHLLSLLDNKKALAEKEEVLAGLNDTIHAQQTTVLNLQHEIAALNEFKRRDDADHHELAEHLTRIASEREVSQCRLHVLEGEAEEGHITVNALEEALALAYEAQQQVDDQQAQSRTVHDQILEGINQLERKADVHKNTITHEETKQLTDERQMEKLVNERTLLVNSAIEDHVKKTLHEDLAEKQAEKALSDAALEKVHRDRHQLNAALQEAKTAQHNLIRQYSEYEGRLSALELLQQSLLRQHNTAIEAPLYEAITVADGWDKAVESVISRWLALSTHSRDSGYYLGKREQVFSAQHLGYYITAKCALGSLLGHVFVVIDDTALSARQSTLAPHEWLVAKNGDLYGCDWFLPYKARETDGVLERSKEINWLQESLQQLTEERRNLDEQLTTLMTQDEAMNQALVEQGHMGQTIQQGIFALEKKCSLLEQQEAHLSANHQRLDETIAALTLTTGESQNHIEETRLGLETLLIMVEDKRMELDAHKQQWAFAQEKSAAQRLELKALETRLSEKIRGVDGMISEQKVLTATLERLAKEQDQLEHKRSEKRDEAYYVSALEEKHQQLVFEESGLAERTQGKATVYQEISGLKAQIDHDEQGKNTQEHAMEAKRTRIQELSVRDAEFKAHAEHVAHSWQALLEELSIDEQNIIAQEVIALSEQDFEALLHSVRIEISKMGAVNLVAIDECKTLSERKVYLDEQDEDLNKALHTLENAIRRIDGETRERFMETFNKVNSDFTKLFPQLFGGGEGYLEVLGDDALTSGVSIIARPPGKKPGTIHLLSGGEKALTAMALVFGIFNLNPAPFCMLDEVDAPLDEANVRRLGTLLNEMSDKVQFIFITHNKATMAIADALIGVTMSEPGVSRLVSVNLEKAEAFATS